MSDYPMLISNKLHSFRNFELQKYKKYFTLNHNGPKNVRTVQTIASIGVEMMPQ